MTTTHSFPTSRDARLPDGDDAVCARMAVWVHPGAPPTVEEISGPEAASVVERLFEAAASRARLPVIAIREVVENLVHAGFRDALVSVLDGGRTVRVSDTGPGIADPIRALEPGFSTAGPAERRVIRGAGCGLPLAARLVRDEGGDLQLEANLGGGTVVTLTAPTTDDPAVDTTFTCSSDARVLLALLIEVGDARPERLAAELGWQISRCGRELVVLEAHGLLRRNADGTRSLTPAGITLVKTLF
jgi:anti-sigma regulatory factor (Ser/Thr protein kinase)